MIIGRHPVRATNASLREFPALGRLWILALPFIKILRVGVVHECVFDRTQASHFMNLYDMHQKYSDVISAEMAMGYLREKATVETAFPERKAG